MTIMKISWNMHNYSNHDYYNRCNNKLTNVNITITVTTNIYVLNYLNFNNYKNQKYYVNYNC